MLCLDKCESNWYGLTTHNISSTNVKVQINLMKNKRLEQYVLVLLHELSHILANDVNSDHGLNFMQLMPLY